MTETVAHQRPETAPAASRWSRVVAPVTAIGVLGAATVALHLRDPHQTGSWGLCPSWAIFGVYCPLCGGLRATNDLTNGDLVGAFHSNPLYVVLIPVVVFWLGRWLLDAWRGREVRVPAVLTRPWGFTLIAVVGIGFTIWRNTPYGAWMHP